MNGVEDKLFCLLLNKAKKAANNGEIPVSAIVVHNDQIISCMYNKREKLKDIMAHAEILAIKKAAKKLKRWNLSDCVLYVSLKPCAMCMEVIKQSRINKVIYLLDKPDYKHDYDKTDFQLYANSKYTTSYQQLLSDFFQNKR